jgi:hypothetical protein
MEAALPPEQSWSVSAGKAHGQPARELARRWQTGEVGLLRLLPRLSKLLVLQLVVNGLIANAAEAMTT